MNPIQKLRVGGKEFDFYLIAGDGVSEFGPNRITFNHEPETDYLPSDVQEYIGRELPALKEKERRGEIYNGKGYRLNEFRCSSENKWTLSLTPADFFSYLLTNMRVFEKILPSQNGNPTSIYEKYIIDLGDFRHSVLANRIGQGVTLLTRDKKVMLGRRSSKAVKHPGTIHCSFGEAIELEDRDSFATIVRSAREELSLEVNRDDVVFLAFGITTSYLQPTLFGRVKVDLSSGEVYRGWQGARDKAEAEIFFVDFNPRSLISAMQTLTFSGVAEAMAIFALVNAFGLEEVTRCLAQWPLK